MGSYLAGRLCRWCPEPFCAKNFSILVCLQIALEDAQALCRQLKAEVADGQHRQAVLLEERDDQEATKRSLQAALVDARARGLEADLKGTSLPRYTHYGTALRFQPEM